MDTQSLINIAFGIAGFFGGWVLNTLSKSIIRIEDRISEMPLLYVTKDDYKRDIDEIKGMLTRIFDKLEDKADK
jgi:capsular polysaccharide biosynthesis protein